MFKQILRQLFIYSRLIFGKLSSTNYWSIHKVNHKSFNSRDESLEHFHWRNSQYPGYIKLMPVSKQDGKIVLDYGCGPGNDLVGFAEFSNVKELIAVDVSKPALDLAKKRILLHNQDVNFIHIEENENKIPLENNSVDFIHSSGVLHHCKNLNKILREFKRILRPGGEMNIMVYNYFSIWVHLYTAYIFQIEKGRYSKMSFNEAFSRLTDGKYAPISKNFKPNEFLSIVNKMGFEGKLNGVSISLTEMMCLNKRYVALKSHDLKSEQREFLSSLKFNNKGYPIYKTEIAGINACFNFKNKI